MLAEKFAASVYVRIYTIALNILCFYIYERMQRNHRNVEISFSFAYGTFCKIRAHTQLHPYASIDAMAYVRNIFAIQLCTHTGRKLCKEQESNGKKEGQRERRKTKQIHCNINNSLLAKRKRTTRTHTRWCENRKNTIEKEQRQSGEDRQMDEFISA